MSTSSTVPRHLRSWQSQLFISQRGRPALLHAFFINVVVSALCAASLAIWILVFSDSWGAIYSVIGGVVTAGGVAWKAIHRLPFGKRIKALPRWAKLQLPHPTPGFCRVTKILNRISLSISVFLLLAFGLTFLVGSLVVVHQNSASQDDRSQGGQLLRSGNEGASEDVQFGKRLLLWASWWQRKPATVRVAGYPDRAAFIRPWFPAKMVFPDSFVDRPVTLVIVNPILACSNPPGCRMQMRLSGPSRNANSEEIEFAGNIFWLGCEGRVKVPSTLGQQLGTALTDPLPPCRLATELRVGDTAAMILTRSGSTIGCGQVSVAATGIPDDFQTVLFVNPVRSGGQC